MPRPIESGAGLPGVSQEVFGEQAKTLGRNFVLDGEATIIRFVAGMDSGGAPNDEWVPDSSSVPAHLEAPSQSQNAAQMTAEQISERSPHIIYMHPVDAAGVTTQDRLGMIGKTWIIMGIDLWNKPETIAFKVEEITA